VRILPGQFRFRSHITVQTINRLAPSVRCGPGRCVDIRDVNLSGIENFAIDGRAPWACRNVPPEEGTPGFACHPHRMLVTVFGVSVLRDGN